MGERPVIGITKPAEGDTGAFLAMRLAVLLAGGKPLKLTAKKPWREVKLSGLIIGGGADVFPVHYGHEPRPLGQYDHDRDEMELWWAKQARLRDVPVLAICRGAQLINVANGGDLHSDLHLLYEDVDYPSTLSGHIFYRKLIKITEGSLLHSILGSTRAHVNSIHKQAIGTIGDNLVVTAKETNGVVQAVEDPAQRFYLGVQFHPEFLIHRNAYRNLFNRLVEAARYTNEPV